MEPIHYDHILVRYGELSTKGKNRKDFIKAPAPTNVRACADDAYPNIDVSSAHYDRMYIHLQRQRNRRRSDAYSGGRSSASVPFPSALRVRTVISTRSWQAVLISWRMDTRSRGPSRWRPAVSDKTVPDGQRSDQSCRRDENLEGKRNEGRRPPRQICGSGLRSAKNLLM